jgi:predicted dehydrogenase
VISEKLKVAVIGVGYGQAHLAAFAARRDVEIAAVVAQRRERAEEAGERFGAGLRTTSYREALAIDELDAVAIAGPAGLHAEMTLAALERGCHVLCEKPLAATVAEGESMLAAAESAGRVHATNYDWRVIPNFRKLHTLLEDGYVGEIQQVHVRWVAPWDLPEVAWTWRNSRRQAGFGVLGDQSHILDDLHWHLGPIARVSADLQVLVPERVDEEGTRRPCDTEDAVSFVAVTATGVQISGQVSRSAVHTGYRTIECLGTRGMLNLTMPSADDREETVLLGAQGVGPPVDLSVAAGPPPVETTQDIFVEAVRGERPDVATSFVDGLAAMRLAEAMRESSDQGRWIDLAVVARPDGRVAYRA